MKSTLVSLLVAAALVYAGLCLYLYLMQRSLMYFPTPPARNVPAERLSINSGDATVVVWRLHGEKRNAILYFGGNAEDVALNVPEFSDWFSQFAVYLVNYRGYGGSSGSPAESALYRDAEAVFEFASAHHTGIAVIGRSLGSGVATHLASVRTVERLVLVSPAASFTALAHELYPFFPTSWLLKDRYDSLSRAGGIAAPVLVLIAEHDRIVRPGHSLKLASAIDQSLVRTHTIANADHNSIGASEEYGPALRAFLTAALPQ